LGVDGFMRGRTDAAPPGTIVREPVSRVDLDLCVVAFRAEPVGALPVAVA
jgi:hypothetical protein